MFKTTLLAFSLMFPLCSRAADAGRPVRHLSDLPAGAQSRIMETLAQGVNWEQLAELTASDGTTSDEFGVSVAISGDTVVVGAPLATIGQNQYQGAAYVFVKPPTGWKDMTQVAKLTASNGEASDEFGNSVAISGNTIVVGNGQGSEGGAYVFTKPRGGWRSGKEAVELSCAEGAVAVSGDTVVCSYGYAAAVYVKPKTGWRSIKTYAALLEATDPDTSFFSLAIDRGTVVGGNEYNNNNQGAAYVFVKPKHGWGVRRTQTQTAKLTDTGGENGGGYFGWSVAVHGDTIAVGAPDIYGVSCDADVGAAYVFVKPASGWQNMTQTAELGDSSLGMGANFGYAVAVQGNTLVVGDMAGDNADNHQGLADVFLEPQGGWADTCSPNATLRASDGQSFDMFGVSAAISGNTFVIGSGRWNIGQKGAAYVFGP